VNELLVLIYGALDKDTNCHRPNILQGTSIVSVSLIGTFMVFGIGVVYCFLHTVITRKMYPMYNGRSIWLIRLFISVLGLFFFILSKLILYLKNSHYSGKVLQLLICSK